MGYDANDRLTSLVSSVDVGGPELGHLQSFEYGYDPAGNRTFVHKMLQSDRSEHYGYDNRDRLTGMDRGDLLPDRSGVATAINSPLLDSKQQWTDLDRRGNWKDYRWTDSPSGTPALHQRTSTVNGVNAYLNVDPDGAATGQPCTAGCLPSVTLTYDAAGNLTLNPLARVVGDAPGTNAGQWYKYDEENRVVEIRKASSTGPVLLQVTYDALGRRVQTTEYVDPQSGAEWDGLSGRPSPRATRHVYSGLTPIQEYSCGGPGAPACDGSYTLAREFVWGRPLSSSSGPEPIAMVDYTGANGVSGCDTGTPPVGCAYHYLRDALGSVTGLTDATGNLVERYTNDPYGKTLIERYDPSANGGAGAWIATNASSLGNPFMWTGHRYDAAVGLYHTLFRHYSPQLGRWLQRDPIGYAGGSVNLYEYVLGNPLYWVDPFGLFGDLPWWVEFTDRFLGKDWKREQQIVQTTCAVCDGIGLVADAASLGGTAIVRAGAKKVGKAVAKEAVEEVAERAAREAAEKAAKEAAEKAAKEAAEKAATKCDGTIYKVPGSGTPSGKPYIGRHNKENPAKTRRSADGRDRNQAEVIDRYDSKNIQEGKLKEQKAIDDAGGIKNLDNHRNEIKKTQ